MIDALRRLAEGLGSDPASAAAAVRQVGPIVDDQGVSASLAFGPGWPELESARLVRRPDGTLSHVVLVPATTIRTADLVAAFGEPSRPPRLHWNSPRVVVFRHGGSRLIAEVAGGDRVRSITVQPD